jgi:hypothetical protein
MGQTILDFRFAILDFTTHKGWGLYLKKSLHPKYLHPKSKIATVKIKVKFRLLTLDSSQITNHQ